MNWVHGEILGTFMLKHPDLTSSTSKHKHLFTHSEKGDRGGGGKGGGFDHLQLYFYVKDGKNQDIVTKMQIHTQTKGKEDAHYFSIYGNTPTHRYLWIIRISMNYTNVPIHLTPTCVFKNRAFSRKRSLELCFRTF